MLKLRLIILMLGLQFASMLTAQGGWERFYGSDEQDRLVASVQVENGDFVLAGTQQIAALDREAMWLIRIDQDGELIWERSWSAESVDLLAQTVELTAAGEILVAGNSRISIEESHAAFWRLDQAGNTLDQWLSTVALDLKDAELSDSELVTITGNYLIADSLSTLSGIRTAAINFISHDILWEVDYETTEVNRAEAISVLNNGNFAIVGHMVSSSSDFDVLLLILESDSVTVAKNIGSTFPELAYDITERNEEIQIIGQTETFESAGDDLFLLTTSLVGDSLNFQIFNSDGQDFPSQMRFAENGDLLVVGNTRLENSITRDLAFWKIQDTGTFDRKLFGGFDTDLANDLQLLPSGQILISGYTQSFGFGMADGYVLLLDSLALSFSSGVFGNISQDINLDCSVDSIDVPLENWIVIAEGAEQVSAATSDAMGNYDLALGLGDFLITLVPPSDYWAACIDSVIINIDSTYQQELVNFSVQTEIDCPLLYVDVSTPFLRRCFPNRYSIATVNNGTAIAEDARLELVVDPFLIVDSFSIDPIAQADNVYEFELGDLAPLASVDFNMWVTVDCDATVLGQTHCVEAHVTPDSICAPLSPEWNQSSLVVGGTCEGDSITFTITNEGAGGTGGNQAYVIIEDDIMLFADSVDLDPGEDTTIVIADPMGATYRLEVEQSVGHPGNDNPSVTIEGCGGIPNTGYVIILPQNDGNPFADIDCRENRGAYDPNAKGGFPKGYGNENYIAKNTSLEYLLQFQNTGTDTAFTVVLRDTLSSKLDLSSLQVGASSHDYSWSLEQGNILTIKYENISLPDSNVNLAGSEGWMEYKINPKQEVPNGTKIFNSVGIYFDFNPPVITNRTLHTIGENFIIIDLVDATEDVSTSDTQFTVYPNPLNTTLWFVLPNEWTNHSFLSLYTLEGRLMFTKKVDEDLLELDMSFAPPGFYIYEFQREGTRLATGKIIVQR